MKRLWAEQEQEFRDRIDSFLFWHESIVGNICKAISGLGVSLNLFLREFNKNLEEQNREQILKLITMEPEKYAKYGTYEDFEKYPYRTLLAFYKNVNKMR